MTLKNEPIAVIAEAFCTWQDIRSLIICSVAEELVVDRVMRLEVNISSATPKSLVDYLLRAIEKKWKFDAILLDATEWDLQTLVEQDFFSAAKLVTNKLVVSFVHVSKLTAVEKFVAEAGRKGFSKLDQNLFVHCGTIILSYWPELNEKETLDMSNIYRCKAFLDADCIDINLGLLDAHKEYILSNHKDVQKIHKDWRLSAFPRRKKIELEQFFSLQNGRCERIDASNDLPPLSVDITFVTVMSVQPEWMLDETIRSLRTQIYPHWHLIVVVADNPTLPKLEKLEACYQDDERISFVLQNGTIEISSVIVRDQAESRIYGFVGCGDSLERYALSELLSKLSRYPSAQCFETDVVEVSDVGLFKKLYLGPTAKRVGGIDQELYLFTMWRQSIQTCGSISLDENHDSETVHIPRACYRKRINSDFPYWSDKFAKIFCQPTEDLQTKTFRTPAGRRRIRWNPINDLVSIICVTYFADDAVIKAIRRLQLCAQDYAVEFIVTAPLSVSFSIGNIKFINCSVESSMRSRLSAAVAMSKGRHVIFMDVAFRPMFPDWIGELVGPIVDLHAGIVGGRVIGRNGGRTSCGITFDVNGRVIDIDGELETRIDARLQTKFFDTLCYSYRFAISGGVVAMPRSLFGSLNITDMHELFPRIDIDLCVRARNQSKEVFYNPFAAFWSFGPALLSDWTDSEEWGGLWLRSNYPGGDPLSNSSFIYTDETLYLWDTRLSV